MGNEIMTDLFRALAEAATQGEVVHIRGDDNFCGPYIQTLNGDICDCYTYDDVLRKPVNFQGETAEHNAAFIAWCFNNRATLLEWQERQEKVAELEAIIAEARDMLLEKVHGNPARSAAHNARVVLDRARAIESPHPTPKPLAEGELAGCPWCGDDRFVRDVEIPGNVQKHFHAVICDDCLAYGPARQSKADARYAWNHRAQASGTFVDGVEAAVKECEKMAAHCFSNAVGTESERAYAFAYLHDAKLAIRAISAPPAQGEG
jgi:Lar family restriction alleviation protein